VVNWIAQFAAATTHAANLAARYLGKVEALVKAWRAKLAAASDPRADAAAWAIINILPAHPVITAPVAAASVTRTKAAIYEAVRQLVEAGVLIPLSASSRNQSWEAAGLLELLEELEAGGEVENGGI
jgi:hypothetical protein